LFASNRRSLYHSSEHSPAPTVTAERTVEIYWLKQGAVYVDFMGPSVIVHVIPALRASWQHNWRSCEGRLSYCATFNG